MSRLIEFDLPARPEAATNEVLLALLRANPVLPVRISARHRRRMDVPLLQILLAASHHWRARGIPFELADLSPDQTAELALLGLTPDLLPCARAEGGTDRLADGDANGGAQLGAA